jgi:hypothetical protein
MTDFEFLTDFLLHLGLPSPGKQVIFLILPSYKMQICLHSSNGILFFVKASVKNRILPHLIYHSAVSPCFRIWHCCVYIATLSILAVLPWRSHLSFMTLISFICKMWQIIPRSLVCCVEQTKYYVRNCILRRAWSIVSIHNIFYFSVHLENTLPTHIF